MPNRDLAAPLHVTALAPASQAALSAMSRCPAVADFYLAGSAALALHLAHRPVRDLDLMGSTTRLLPPERRDLLAALREVDPNISVETARDGYLFVRLGSADESVGVRFFYYPYPLVDPLLEDVGVPVAGLRDLGLMKLAAIISRGSRRDALDLYLLCREQPFAGLLTVAAAKFGHVRDFSLQALKGLAAVTAAPPEPLPRLANPVGWEEVSDWCEASARDLGRAHVGLAPQ